MDDVVLLLSDESTTEPIIQRVSSDGEFIEEIQIDAAIGEDTVFEDVSSDVDDSRLAVFELPPR